MTSTPTAKSSHQFALIAAGGATILSPIKGTLGGHRRTKVFGLLECPAALRAIARGGYTTQRVFFLDAQSATAAGYRPCAICMPDAYSDWKKRAIQPTMTRVPLEDGADAARHGTSGTRHN